MSFAADRTILSDRTYACPPQRLWKAWTDPDEIRLWWGPTGFSNHFYEYDLRPEGTWRFVMRGPTGQEFPNESRFTLIVPNERLEFDHLHGPLFHVVAQFTAVPGGTHLRWTMEFPTVRECEAIRSFVMEANLQNLDRLEALLSAPPLVIERTVNAPPAQVWKAVTDPAAMKQWYFDIPEFRAEVGARFTFTGGPPDRIYVHRCEVTEVLPEMRLSHTWTYDGVTGSSLVTFELFAQGSGTCIRLTHSGLESFPSQSDPNLARTSFEAGWTQIIGTSLITFLQKS